MPAAKIILIIVQFAALIFFVAYIDLLSLFLLIFSLLLPVILFITNKISKRNIFGEITSSIIAGNKGDDIKITVNVRNSGKIPVIASDIKICFFNTLDGQKQYANISMPLQAGNTHSIFFTISSQYCGKLRICFESIRIFDFIKLFSAVVRSDAFAEIIILPQPKSINAVCSGMNNSLIDSDRFSKTRPGDDPSEIFDIRYFKDGDRINRIHWKLSSRSEELIVKEYSYAINCSVLLLIDFFSAPAGKNNMERLDAIVELALSLSEIILMNAQPFNVGWYSEKNKVYCTQFIDNDEDFAVFLGRLFEDGAYSGQFSAISAFTDNLKDIKYSHILYITPKISPESVDFLKYSCESDEKTLLYVSDKSAETVGTMLKELNFTLPHIVIPQNNIEYFAGELII